jgi:hypothetical protein
MRAAKWNAWSLAPAVAATLALAGPAPALASSIWSWNPVTTSFTIAPPPGPALTSTLDIVQNTGAAFMWPGGFSQGILHAEFRRSVDFGACFSTPGCTAPILFAADDYAEIFVDGRSVGDYYLDSTNRNPPGGSNTVAGQSPNQPIARSFDLAPFLTRDGHSNISIIACDTYSRPSSGDACDPGARSYHWVFLAGNVEYSVPDGDPILDLAFVSDGSWEARAIPEPASAALVGLSLLALTGLRRRWGARAAT